LKLVTRLHPLLGADEVSGEVVADKSLLFMVLKSSETGTFVHTAVCVLFVLSCLILSMALPEEMLTLLVFFHCENFSILMKDIYVLFWQAGMCLCAS